jgi:hypothetical protein
MRHPLAWLRMPTARAARIIARAAARRRGEVVITGHGRAAVVLQRHAPWLLAGLMGRFGAWRRREPGTSA